MTIDLTHKIIQPTAKAAKKPVRLHPLRRLVQVLCGVLIVLAPLLNLYRMDLRERAFWLLGHRFGVDSVILYFWGAALFTFALMAISLLYGRWWCGWICPQTLASDFGDSVKNRIVKALRAKYTPGRMPIALGIWAAVMVAWSVLAAGVLGSYFIAPHIVWSVFANPAANPGVALGVWITAAVVAIDLLAVRRFFCKSVCPYGLFLSLSADKRTLNVRYLAERDGDCIKCGKCVRVCPTGVDIRNGANQKDCIGCGECVDACNSILPRLKPPKPGLIAQIYGEQTVEGFRALTGWQRLGVWDAKRVLLLASVAVTAAGFCFAALVPHPSTLVVVPSGVPTRSGTIVTESFALTLTNGQPQPEKFAMSIVGMDGARITEPLLPVAIADHTSKAFTITVAGSVAAGIHEKRYAAAIDAHGLNQPRGHADASCPIIFYAP